MKKHQLIYFGYICFESRLPKVTEGFVQHSMIRESLLRRDSRYANSVNTTFKYCLIGFFTSENEYLITGDTIINGKNCSVVEKTFQSCDLRPKTEYIHKSEDDKLFFYNQNSETYSLLYDFGAQVGDVVKVPMWNWQLGDTLRYRIDCITEELIGDKMRKKFYVSETYYTLSGDTILGQPH